MFTSTKIIELGSCAFRQPNADSHCKFIHGYRLTAKFWFRSETLDHNNWVVDFGGLKPLKKELQDQFDHTTCISRTDPKLEQFKRLRDEGVCDLRIMDGVGIEKFAEYCHGVADEFVGVTTDMRCRCVAVEVFEHENNSAIYSLPAKELTNDKREDVFSVPEQEPVATEPENAFSVPVKQKTPAPLNCKKSTNWIDKESTNTWGI